MATVTVRKIVSDCASILQDEGYDDWTETELVEWYNLSAREVVRASPAANPVVESVLLASGVKQVLPAGSLEFIRAVSNMGTDGVTRGEAITPSTIDMLQAWDRNWAIATATTPIKHAMKEPGRNWYCYPPSDGTGYVEIEVSKVPTVVTWDEDGEWESALVGVEDPFVMPLLHHILFLAYSKDKDFPGNESRATKHYELFSNGVGK